ncbi:hypothetical protein KAR48_16915 [bacterium]|nr:hypothetical protein [bacterium]
MIFWHLIKNDFRFQFRHGIQNAYAVVIALYIAVIHLLPITIRQELLTGLLFSDVTVFGFFFVGGIVLLEKSQGVLSPLFMTPVPPVWYLCSKVITMMLNSLFFGSILIICSGITVINWSETLVSVLLMSALFTTTGLIIAMRAQHINSYFLLAVPVTMLMAAPMALLALPQIHSWLWLNPVTGGWQIMASGLLGHDIAIWQAVLVTSVSIIAAMVLAKNWLYRFVITGGQY